jgi:hypothetical protein
MFRNLSIIALVIILATLIFTGCQKDSSEQPSNSGGRTPGLFILIGICTGLAIGVGFGLIIYTTINKRLEQRYRIIKLILTTPESDIRETLVEIVTSPILQYDYKRLTDITYNYEDLKYIADEVEKNQAGTIA